MSTNPLYIASPPLQYFFVDRDTGEPLSGGRIFTYSDINRATPKNTYQLQGNQANYTYVPLPNPIILSAEGTIVDNNGNNVVPLWYPYNAEGEPELYYVVVQSATGVPQFTLQAWPYPSATNSNTNNANGIFNYIPNGQFLAHTDLPDNVLLPGTNVIAQGGWTIELDSGATSTNTLTFIENAYTQNPPESPRYSINFACTVPVGTEVLKDIRIKFPDVNKFSDQGLYTYGFWMKSTFTVPFVVEVVAYYGTGGTPRPAYDQQIGQVTTEGTFFSFPINFGSGSGYNVGPDGDDFIAIDISFPTDTAFNITFTDAVLAYGLTTALTAFPTQTNADMLTRGVAGWMPTPNPDGSDLYLPLLLTREGMIWDNSEIGDIGQTVGTIPATSASSAISNKMPCDGTIYDPTENSYLGIPYSRLLNWMLSENFAQCGNYFPIYGTGADFATCWSGYSTDNIFTITSNNAGTPIAIANDGAGLLATGWTFNQTCTFLGVITGSASLNFNCYWDGNTLVSFNGNGWLNPFFNNAGGSQFWLPQAGTSGFTLTINSQYQGIYGNQFYSFNYITVAASALAVTSGNTCKFIQFASNTTRYTLYFRVNGIGNTPNQTSGSTNYPNTLILDLDSTMPAKAVAYLTRNICNALQTTSIEITAIPTAGQYWQFQANPASLETYNVWYSVNGAGSSPSISGTPIEVELTNIETDTTVFTKTQIAINSYQYAAPDFRGLTLRGYDPNSTWDMDSKYRLMTNGYTNLGPAGLNLGTFEYSMSIVTANVQSSGVTSPQDSSVKYYPPTVANASSSTIYSTPAPDETRSVNTGVNFYIKY